MPESSSWDVLVAPDSGRTVLGVDFPVAGRRAAGFADLAAMLGPRYRFLRARPRSASPGDGLSGEAYTEAWIEQLRRDREPVLAIFGHGVGCVYAAEIADAVCGWQQTPAVILFDPELASVRLLSRALSAEVRANEAILSAAEIERATRAVADIAARPGPIASVAREIVETYLGVLSVPWERIGLGDLRDSTFARSFAAQIAWLAAASVLDPGHAWDRSTVIMSAGHTGHAGTPGAMSGPDSRRIQFDVDQAGLLGAGCVAGAVLELLGSR